MVLGRASPLRSAFRQSTLCNAGARARGQSWRQSGKRFYASGHGPAKASSDIPWMIGSVAFTVPAATWLYQQGPVKGEHGHGHAEHEEHEEPEEPEEKSEEKSEEEPKDEGDEKEEKKDNEEEKPKDEGDDKPKDEEKPDDSSEGGDEKDTPESSDDEKESKK